MEAHSDAQRDTAFPGIRVLAGANSPFFGRCGTWGLGSDGVRMILKVFFNLNNKEDNYCVGVMESQSGLGWEQT